MIVVGVIGPIAAGKGRVAEELARLGATVIRADDISRKVVAPGSPTLAAVLREFGDAYRLSDGSLDRARMARLIFRDSSARRRLERIVHPPMVQGIERRLAALREAAAPPAMVVVEAANLVEMGGRGLVDLIARVDAPPAARLARLMARDGLSEADALARMRTQDELKLGDHAADIVLKNDGAPTELRAQVERLWTQTTGQMVARE